MAYLENICDILKINLDFPSVSFPSQIHPSLRHSCSNIQPGSSLEFRASSSRNFLVIPLQCSCLENPRDCGAWWAAFYGVAQSRTRLKRLSSSGGGSSSRSSASISKGLQTVRKDHICHRETLLLHLAKANKRFLF